MGRPIFHFQQFSIRQDKSAMKVGTDGVLVGAWAVREIREIYDGESPASILDIGAGNGVVTLILAQLFPHATVTGIEVDAPAARQARENASESPFSDRVKIYHQSLQELATTSPEKFDYIVSNPPYFVRSFLPKDKARTKARHSTQLPFTDLIQCVDVLLKPTGLLALVLPFNISQSFSIEAAANGLHLVRLTGVRDTVDHPTIRHLLMYSRQQLPFEKNGLTLYKKGREERSAAFHDLTKDLYLQS